MANSTLQGQATVGIASESTAGIVLGSTVRTLVDNGVRFIGYVGTNPEVGGSSPFQLTSSHKRVQIVNPGAAITIKLPTTGIISGEEVTIVNRSAAYEVSIQSSGANAIDSLHRGHITLRALVDTPTSAANWKVVDYASFYAVGGQLANVSTTNAYAVIYLRTNSVVSIHVTGLASLATKSGNGSIDLAAAAPLWARPDVTRAFTFRGTYANAKDDLAVTVDSSGGVRFWSVSTTGAFANIPDTQANVGWYQDVFITYPKVNS